MGTVEANYIDKSLAEINSAYPHCTDLENMEEVSMLIGQLEEILYNSS